MKPNFENTKSKLTIKNWEVLKLEQKPKFSINKKKLFPIASKLYSFPNSNLPDISHKRLHKFEFPKQRKKHSSQSPTHAKPIMSNLDNSPIKRLNQISFSPEFPGSIINGYRTPQPKLKSWKDVRFSNFVKRRPFNSTPLEKSF